MTDRSGTTRDATSLRSKVRSRFAGGLLAEALQYVSERSVRLALGALSGVVVARYLGPADLGVLSYVSAVFALLVPLASLGLHQVLVREFASSAQWRAVLASAIARQVPVAVALSLVGFGVVALSRAHDHTAVMIAVVMSPAPVLATEQIIRAYLQATGSVRRIVAVGFVGAFTATAIKLVGVWAQAPVWFFGAVGTIEGCLVLIGLSLAVPARFSISALRRNYDSTRARKLVREAAPLLAAGLAVSVYMKADLLMLGAIKGDAETGLYASAARLSEVWYFIPTAASAAVWPRLAHLHASGEFGRYEGLLRRFMVGLSATAVGAVALVVLGADLIVRVLYGSSFDGAANVLRIHVMASPFVFLGVASSQWFIDRGLTMALFRRTAAGAVVNIGANMLLIPTLGAVGAALATLLSYALSGVFFNLLHASTRPLFAMQMRALIMWRA